MGLAITRTRTLLGIQALPVSVEVHLSRGLPSFSIVGLAETIVKESKERVRSAIINSHFDFPQQRITINLGPAHIPKSGSGFDLAIAIGILAASNQIPSDNLQSYEFSAELALDGQLKGIHGIIPIVLGAKYTKTKLIIAESNAEEAAIVNSTTLLVAKNLNNICSYFCQGTMLSTVSPPEQISSPSTIDWSDVKGQLHAKKALELAACGGHSVLLCGAPGSGKSMLAHRFSTILPPLMEHEALERAAIFSLRGKMPNYAEWYRPSFRAPHHSVSYAGLIGGGNPPKPGEISLAHYGVLFLDELPEFHHHVLETLREPLESGSIAIARAASQVDFPAKFQLIAAMNPCPCGEYGTPRCSCSAAKINRYLAKLSAPLLDRIDMQIPIKPLTEDELLQLNQKAINESQSIQEKVIRIRAFQIERQGMLNAHLTTKHCEAVCLLGEEERALLKHILSRLNLSARGFYRLLKVARTIADQNFQEKVTCFDIKQALSYKQSFKTEKH